MADEQQIKIRISDSIDSSIESKIEKIGNAAVSTSKSIELLNKQLKMLNSSAVKTLTDAYKKLTSAETRLKDAIVKESIASDRAAISKQKLAVETNKALIQERKAEEALNKLIIAENKTAASLTKLNAETAKTAKLQSVAAQNYLKTEEALNKAIIAEGKAAITKEQHAKSIIQTTNANAKLENQVKQNEIAQQRLKTETQRTTTTEQRALVSKNNATAAAKRAELATLRLKTAQDRLATSNKKTALSFRDLAITLGSISAALLTLGRVVKIVDEFTNLQNKLRNVVDSEEQLSQVTERVFEVANDTRTAVDATAQSFQRFDKALQQLGASQEESLRLTETVNKALVIGGAASSEQSAALLQLSQAFNKGKLDGDEFRTVMELMPTVVDAIAKQMGVMRGDLLKLAPQGKITTDVMRKAFANAQKEIDAGFAKTIPTISQSFTVFRNNVVKTLGEIDKRLGVSKAISKTILFLADNIKILTVGLSALSAAFLVAFAPSILATITAIATAVKSFTLALATNPFGLMIVGITTLIALFATFKDDIKVSKDGVISLGQVVQATFELIYEVAKEAFERIVSILKPVYKFIIEGWNTTFEQVSKGTSNLESSFFKSFKIIILTTKRLLNGFIGFWIGAFNVIIKSWERFPTTLTGVTKTAVNSTLSLVEFLVNGSFVALNSLLSLANKAADFLKLDVSFDTLTKLDLTAFKVDAEKEGFDIGNIFKESFEGALSTDFIGDSFKAIFKRAEEIAKRTTLKTPSLRTEESRAPSATEDKRSKALRALNEGLEKELFLLSLLGNEYNNVNKFLSINESLAKKKIILTNDENKALIEKIELLQNEKNVRSELEKIYNQEIAIQTNLISKQAAINKAFDSGIISADSYGKRLVSLQMEATKLRLELGQGDWVDVWSSSMDRLVEKYTNDLNELSNIFGNFFTNIQEGFADSIGQAIVYGDNLGDSLREVARGALAELVSATINASLQSVLAETMKQNAIAQTTAATQTQAATTIAATTAATSAQQTALATQTATSNAAAASTTAAWAPAATTASIGSFGAAAAIGLTAVLAAIAASKAGFQEGGYTGSMPANQVAGVVHGKEFVFDAPATSSIGVSNLEALRNGTARIQKDNGKQKQKTNVATTNGESNEPVLNFTAIVVSSKEEALKALESTEGKKVIIETIDENQNQIARIVGVN